MPRFDAQWSPASNWAAGSHIRLLLLTTSTSSLILNHCHDHWLTCKATVGTTYKNEFQTKGVAATQERSKFWNQHEVALTLCVRCSQLR